MKILFYCNTYMQLINAVNLKINCYKEDIIDLVFSDHSCGAEGVLRRIEKTGIFEKTTFIKTKKYIYVNSKLSRFKDMLLLKSDKNILNFFVQNMDSYDLIFYYNVDLIIYKICDTCLKNGKRPRLIRMEEGILSYPAFYETKGLAIALLSAWRKMMNQFDVYSATEIYAVYYPELLDEITDHKIMKIPVLARQDKKLIQILNYIFDYEPSEKIFKEKYIYFGTSMDIEGIHVGETELVLQLAEYVGKKNILVKMHPRDGRSIYTDNGLMVTRDSSVPWEVIQLNHDFSNHIFISLSSGSIMNATAMLNDNIEIYFLFPCVKGKNANFDQKVKKGIINNLDKFQVNNICKNIKIVNDIKEILNNNDKK